jgi:putative endonuclease
VTRKVPCIYILTNKSSLVLYVGVTNNLLRRVWEHKNKISEGFSSQYNLNKLVYYEFFETMEQAIMREKQLKGGSRKQKLSLINKFNPTWEDLYESLN